MKIARYLPRDSKIVLAKFHQNRLRIDLEIGKKHAIQVNLTAGIVQTTTVILAIAWASLCENRDK